MKTLLIIIGFTTFVIFWAKAQCPISDVTLTTQAEVDNFKIQYPNCTEFTKRIRLEGSINNLNGLSNLTKLYALNMLDLPISSLLPLSNLTEIGIFGLTGCNSLTSLAGLNSLTRAEVFFSNDTPITSLAPLSNLIYLGSLFIRTSNLTNLDGLENVEQMMTLSLVINTSLQNIDAIDDVKFIDSSILGETGKAVQLLRNELLTDCVNEVVCHATMVNGKDYALWEVQGNGTGCATKAEIAQPCLEALPVNLVQFGAHYSGENNVQLNWATSSEIDSKFFEIQRGTNGRSWKTIGTVYAYGKSDFPIQYSFTDKNSIAGNILYRLKMVDIDNTFTFSNIVNVKIANASSITIYPNPVTETLQIPDSELISSAKIIDMNGKEIYKSAGNPGPQISAKHLPAGVLILSLEKQDGSVSRFKFVKK